MSRNNPVKPSTHLVGEPNVVGWGICMWMCLDFKTTKPMSSMYQMFNVSKILQQHHHSQVYGTNGLTCVLTGVVNKYGTLLCKRFITFQEII